MTTIPQADTFNIPNHPEEAFAPSGTIEFAHDEQVDLHPSDLPLSVAELARVANELAAPMHQVVAGEKVDKNRIEFGEEALEVFQRSVVEPSAERLFMHSDELIRIGAALVALRLAQVNVGVNQRGE
jgi:hypothetical protein